MNDSPTPSPSNKQLARVVQFARLWRTGTVRSVEEFLKREQTPDVSVGDLLDLIQQEIQLREEALEVPAAVEYCQRFASLADQVSALFAVNELMVPDRSEAEGPDLPQYRMEGRLGKGAIGDVFRARDEVLGRPLAVKVLRPEWQNDPAATERFWQEACTAARLQHPGIAPVYEAGYSDQDRPYIAMKLIEGRTLADLLVERDSLATSLDRFIVVFEQVCQTMAYAHSQGVLHRDLKPANVMVGAFGEVQVMDWGLAKGIGHAEQGTGSRAVHTAGPFDTTAPPSGLTQDGDMIGTPAYAPPEQIRGEHDRVTAASDVFGLGAILCEILTGRPVFDSVEHGTAANVEPAQARLRESEADRELVALAIECLAADPKERPPDGAAVASAVAACRANQRERLRAAELTEARAASEKKARRRVALLRLVGMLVAAILGIGGWAWYSRQAATVREVTAAADEGQSLREENIRVGGDPALLAAADRSARRAEGLLQGVVGRRELRERVNTLLAELEADARDPEMVRRLDRIRVERTGLGRRDLGGLDAAYTATFREYGINVDAEPDEVARHVGARPARAELTAALDYWASQMTRGSPAGDRATHLLAVARLVDRDPWRNQLREALRTRNAAGLLTLADEAIDAELPASTMVTLGSVLASRSERPDSGLRLLRVARKKFPGDFWANHDLAFYLCRTDPPRWHCAPTSPAYE